MRRTLISILTYLCALTIAVTIAVTVGAPDIAPVFTLAITCVAAATILFVVWWGRDHFG